MKLDCHKESKTAAPSGSWSEMKDCGRRCCCCKLLLMVFEVCVLLFCLKGCRSTIQHGLFCQGKTVVGTLYRCWRNWSSPKLLFQLSCTSSCFFCDLLYLSLFAATFVFT